MIATVNHVLNQQGTRYRYIRAKSHWKAISDLVWTNPTRNRPARKNLSRKLHSHLRTKSVNKTPRHAVSAFLLKEMGCNFLDHLTCDGLAKNRSILVNIVEIHMRKIVHPCRHRDSATNHQSNYFQIKTPSHLVSNICLNLACSRDSHGFLEVCPSMTKFCPLVNKPLTLCFSL